MFELWLQGEGVGLWALSGWVTRAADWAVLGPELQCW